VLVKRVYWESAVSIKGKERIKMTQLEKWIVLVLALSSLTSGFPRTEDADYDYDAANNDLTKDDDNTIVKGNEIEVMATPKFVSAPQSVMVNEGDTVRLPCIVDRLEGFVMLWKRGTDIITVASQIIDKRVRLDEEKNGNHLILGQASPKDSGDYTCQISAYKPTEITHSLLVRVQPEITTKPESSIVVTEGSSTQIECTIISGTPTPEIRWLKKESGEEVTSHTLRIESVTREQAGTYICQADNGFGPEPVKKEVVLQVEYAPNIEVEEAFIVTNMDEEQEIACIVDSYPEAELIWMKNGEIIDESNTGIVFSHKGNRHTLLIEAINKDSVGHYECKATNKLGEAVATADISGDAAPAVVHSNHVGEHQNKFTLKWTSESESKIEMFEVSLRKRGEKDWDLHEVTLDDNVISENDTTDHVNQYHGKLDLTGLEPGTIYEATIASKNLFGLNKPGEIFSFRTMSSDSSQKTEEDFLVETKQKSSSLTSTSSAVTSALNLLLFLSFLALWRQG